VERHTHTHTRPVVTLRGRNSRQNHLIRTDLCKASAQHCTQYNCEKWSCWAGGERARWCSRARNARARYCRRALSLLPREDDAKYEVGARENAVVENINHARASCAPLEHPLCLPHTHISKQEFRSHSLLTRQRVLSMRLCR
jgi:hypothetical protein